MKKKNIPPCFYFHARAGGSWAQRVHISRVKIPFAPIWIWYQQNNEYGVFFFLFFLLFFFKEEREKDEWVENDREDARLAS